MADRLHAWDWHFLFPLFIQGKLIIGNELSIGVKYAVWWTPILGNISTDIQAVYLCCSTPYVWISCDQGWSYSRLLVIIICRHVSNNHREIPSSCIIKETYRTFLVFLSLFLIIPNFNWCVCTNQVLLVDVWSCLVDVIEKWYCLLNSKFCS